MELALASTNAPAGPPPSFGSLSGLGARKFKKKPVLVVDQDELAQSHMMFQQDAADRVNGVETEENAQPQSAPLGLVPMQFDRRANAAGDFANDLAAEETLDFGPEFAVPEQSDEDIQTPESFDIAADQAEEMPQNFDLEAAPQFDEHEEFAEEELEELHESDISPEQQPSADAGAGMFGKMVKKQAIPRDENIFALEDHLDFDPETFVPDEPQEIAYSVDRLIKSAPITPETAENNFASDTFEPVDNRPSFDLQQKPPIEEIEELPAAISLEDAESEAVEQFDDILAPEESVEETLQELTAETLDVEPLEQEAIAVELEADAFTPVEEPAEHLDERILDLGSLESEEPAQAVLAPDELILEAEIALTQDLQSPTPVEPELDEPKFEEPLLEEPAEFAPFEQAPEEPVETPEFVLELEAPEMLVAEEAPVELEETWIEADEASFDEIHRPEEEPTPQNLANFFPNALRAKLVRQDISLARPKASLWQKFTFALRKFNAYMFD